MHDVGMNVSQLSMSIRQVDDAIALARTWNHDLYHATDAFAMDQTSAKLAACMDALDQAREALAGYEEAIEADHNAIGSVRLV